MMKNKVNIIQFQDLDEYLKDNRSVVEAVLMDAMGQKSNLEKFPREEVMKCVRFLIYKAYIRGTIIDNDNCVWSRPTRKGKYYFKLLRNENNI